MWVVGLLVLGCFVVLYLRGLPEERAIRRDFLRLLSRQEPPDKIHQ